MSAETSVSDQASRVFCRIEGHIARVTLSRPDKHNGLDFQMIQELIRTARMIRKDKTVRAVILSGAGESFCAGLDFKAVSKTPSMIARLFLKLPWTSMNSFQRVALIWRNLPVPVISVIQGNCFGGGLQIALGSDYRIARPDAQFSVMEMKWGLVPDMSATVTLTTLTRYDTALELSMTGRQFSGEEAFGYGLVSKLSDNPETDAEQLASVLIQKSPDALAALKLLFRKVWKAGPRRSLLWERWIQTRLLGRKNQRIAQNNGLGRQKQPKPFVDRSLF